MGREGPRGTRAIVVEGSLFVISPAGLRLQLPAGMYSRVESLTELCSGTSILSLHFISIEGGWSLSQLALGEPERTQTSRNPVALEHVII